MRLTALILLVVLGGAAIYVGLVWLVAFIEVKNLPRAPLFICPRHGPIKKEYLITFQSGAETTVEYCSICFHERLQNAERIQ